MEIYDFLWRNVNVWSRCLLSIARWCHRCCSGALFWFEGCQIDLTGTWDWDWGLRQMISITSPQFLIPYLSSNFHQFGSLQCTRSASRVTVSNLSDSRDWRTIPIVLGKTPTNRARTSSGNSSMSWGSKY